MALSCLALFSGCKKDKDQDSELSVEKQWMGVVTYEDEQNVNVCFDLGITNPGKVTVGMNMSIFSVIPGVNAGDYIYTDESVMPYTVKFTDKTSGVVCITSPEDGEVMEVGFMNLTKDSVTLVDEDETIELTAGKASLVRINPDYSPFSSVRRKILGL